MSQAFNFKHIQATSFCFSLPSSFSFVNLLIFIAQQSINVHAHIFPSHPYLCFEFTLISLLFFYLCSMIINIHCNQQFYQLLVNILEDRRCFIRKKTNSEKLFWGHSKNSCESGLKKEIVLIKLSRGICVVRLGRRSRENCVNSILLSLMKGFVLISLSIRIRKNQGEYRYKKKDTKRLCRRIRVHLAQHGVTYDWVVRNHGK